MSPFQSVSLAMAGMAAAPAGCFLASIRLLPLPAALILAGCVSWGPRWMLRLSAASSVPLFLLVWGLLRHDGPAAERAARWALALGSGLFFASLSGTGRMSWWLWECSKMVTPVRGILADLSLMIRSAIPAASHVRSKLGSGRASPAELAGAIRSSVQEALAEPPLEAPGKVSVWVPAAGAAAWLFAMAGLAGL